MVLSSQKLEPLGDFKPSDQWATHVNTLFYGTLGPAIHKHFQTFASLDHRLAHALARDHWTQARTREGRSQIVHEWGVGNGNLAGCFLTHLQEIDTEHGVYPRTQYVLCDYSEEILRGARENPRLKPHTGRFSPVRVDVGQLDCFLPNSVDRILSNEIWDDMATRVLLKHDGLLYEEYLQPYLDPQIPGTDFDAFREGFNGLHLDILKHSPPFLSSIQWEHSFQRVDLGDWPYGETLQAHMEAVDEEIPVPINLGGMATLERAKKLLKPDGGGYTGFDYGMLSLADLNQKDRPYFNLYGGQYTFMVNFELLAEIGRAVGFENVTKEYQHEYVGRMLNARVASLVDLVKHHPQTPRLAPWDRDILMLQTLNALNNTYKCPYSHKMEYPPMDGTPKKQRKQIAQLSKNLNPRGVPDTVAYVTEKEVFSALGPLKRLGYRDKDLQRVFAPPREPVSFIRIHFQ